MTDVMMVEIDMGGGAVMRMNALPVYNAIVKRMIEDGYIDKQWTPEERQEWMDKMVMKK